MKLTEEEKELIVSSLQNSAMTDAEIILKLTENRIENLTSFEIESAIDNANDLIKKLETINKIIGEK